MRRAVVVLATALASTLALAQAQILEATTAAGEKVLLRPNGRWEFVDQGKQREARKVADQYPENRPRVPDAQGGWSGFGRSIPPGDPDYNRGSLGGKGR